jgi:phosphodiesterase/alkaline phosphatase D-like protein
MAINFFDPKFYRAANPDLGNLSDREALAHFQNVGLKEGRAFSSLVDLDFYRQNNPGLKDLSYPELLNHLQNFGLQEGRKFSPVINLDYYRKNNPALENFSNEQLLKHFKNFGRKEGRSPSAFFQANAYLNQNPQLKNAGITTPEDAYQHYVLAGLKEARSGNVKSNTLFNGVASGDATQNNAILWTRTADAITNQGKISDLIVQVSRDPQFRTIDNTFVTKTDPLRDYTAKIDDSFLSKNTRYYYRFQAPGGEVSPVGTFKTAPKKTDNTPLKMAFSADTAGEWRPYGFTKNFDQLNLDFFVYLGDTIYETKSGDEKTGFANSPETADPLTNFPQAIADYHRKYLENLQAVNPGGFPGLQKFYQSQGNYTLLDNHELGDKQFANGGAPASNPPGTPVDATNPIFDVNTTGSFINKTPGFKDGVVQAYKDYQPIREKKISAPNDPRTDGTDQLYFAQRWGQNAMFVNVDDRSYRDIRMKKTTADGKLVDDTGTRADNPNRTMLGSTQFDWLKQTLLQAQKDGVTWKILAISTPIDENASSSGNKIIPLDTGKTWVGGYRAERNNLLKFIADNGIENVVFITTDDHENRVNEVTYFAEPGNPNSARVKVPNAFSIVAGPLGAFGPGLIKDHSFANIKSLADGIVAQQKEKGVDPLGLDPAFPGLKNVFREGDPQADSLRQPVDFYSPDTFNYVTLDVTGDGKTLSVNTYGINPYDTNTFPESSQVSDARRILGFDIDASVKQRSII